MIKKLKFSSQHTLEDESIKTQFEKFSTLKNNQNEKVKRKILHYSTKLKLK